MGCITQPTGFHDAGVVHHAWKNQPFAITARWAVGTPDTPRWGCHVRPDRERSYRWIDRRVVSVTHAHTSSDRDISHSNAGIAYSDRDVTHADHDSSHSVHQHVAVAQRPPPAWGDRTR